MSMENSNDTIGNRTRDLPACSAVLQPTAPRRAPQKHVACIIKMNIKKLLCLTEIRSLLSGLMRFTFTNAIGSAKGKVKEAR
jgi:hypothetical protein